jgi:hypothetical protein
MLSSTHMRIEHPLAGPHFAVVALSPTRFDDGVHALKRTHACREYARKATPCCHGTVSGALHHPLKRAHAC